MTSEATKGQTPDIYGQVHPVETPQLIERKHAEMEIELGKLSEDDLISLRQAEEKCPELLTDEFRLMFLRAEVFNADLAAKRYAAYWKNRVNAFGPEKAFMPLTLEGALNGSEGALSLGVLTLLPGKDSTGRSMIFCDPSKFEKNTFSIEEMIPVLWYVVHAALENEVSQKCGVVAFGDARRNRINLALIQALSASLGGAVPVRWSVLHLVHPAPVFQVAFSIAKVFISRRVLERFVVHLGSDKKTLSNLNKKYRLSKNVLPDTIGGDVTINNDGWLLTRKSLGL